MKRIFGLFLISGLISAESYSQGHSYCLKADSAVADDSYFNVRINIKNGLFNSILEDFLSSQQQVSKLLSFREEAERLQKAETDNINRIISRQRVDIFTNRIGLTEKEAVAFWPKYEEYLLKLEKILEKREESVQKLCDIYIVLPEKQANVWADVYVNSFEEEANLMKQYKEKFKSILGTEKLPRLYDAEFHFKMWMLRNF